jgi:DNA repair protein RadC
MDSLTPHKFTIKSLSEEDRPREKLLQKGINSLSDAELIAILIGSGNKTQNAVELSRFILSQASHNLNQLAKLSISDLQKFDGIGEAKALSIICALEVGRRRSAQTSAEKPKITCSADAFDQLYPLMTDIPHEEFWMLSLSRSNKVLKKDLISKGGLSGTLADPKVIFEKALSNKASSIIISHNHPSGNRAPSKADIQLTKKIRDGAKLLDIKLLDHIIVADQAYYSFLDEGYL